MDKESNKTSLTLSIIFHIFLIIGIIGFKSAHIMVPSRSDGIEVSLISSDEISPQNTQTPSPKPDIEPVKTLDQSAEINLNTKHIQINKPKSKAIVQPKPEAKPTPETKQQKPQKKITKAKPNAQISDLLSDIATTKSTGKTKAPATGGVSGTADSNNLKNNYADLIIEKVRPFVIIPDNLSSKAKAIVEVILLPNLHVYNVKLIKSSGNPEYDNNIQDAIKKVTVFPPLPDGVEFIDYRKLILTFRP